MAAIEIEPPASATTYVFTSTRAARGVVVAWPLPMTVFRSIARALAMTLVFSACGAAAPAPETSPAPAPAVRAGRPLLLWSIRTDDGQQSYVLGTYHIGVHIDEVLPPPHARSLEGARVLMVEIDMADADPTALLAQAMLPQGEDLHDLIPPDIWPRLVSALVDVVPEPAVHRLRPWFAMSLVMSREAGALESERREGTSGADAPSALDAQVMERARARGAPIIALETVEEQGAMMAQLPIATVVQYLETALQPRRSQRPLADLLRAYLEGDIAALEALVFDPAEWGDSPELMEAFIFARNERWLDRIEAEVRRGDAFVAVGAAHLLGPRGLVRLLEARGYTCLRVHAEPEREHAAGGDPPASQRSRPMQNAIFPRLGRHRRRSLEPVFNASNRRT